MPPFPRHRPEETPPATAAQAEAERWVAARAARAVPGQAAAILARAGVGRAPEPVDALPADFAARLAARKR
ncbi:MAG: hypothetical protein ACOYOH_27765 [Paracraurococcus sp.]